MKTVKYIFNIIAAIILLTAILLAPLEIIIIIKILLVGD